MAKTIILSDEYSWTASFGLFEWVLEFLLNTVSDSTTKKELQERLDHNLPGLDVLRMPEVRRREVLRALREHLVLAAESSPELRGRDPERRFTIGHIKVLKLMADEVARSVDENETSLTDGQ
jgi:hypothetical protein